MTERSRKEKVEIAQIRKTISKFEEEIRVKSNAKIVCF
jgi:hypothetical protein